MHTRGCTDGLAQARLPAEACSRGRGSGPATSRYGKMVRKRLTDKTLRPSRPRCSKSHWSSTFPRKHPAFATNRLAQAREDGDSPCHRDDVALWVGPDLEFVAARSTQRPSHTQPNPPQPPHSSPSPRPESNSITSNELESCLQCPSFRSTTYLMPQCSITNNSHGAVTPAFHSSPPTQRVAQVWANSLFVVSGTGTPNFIISLFIFSPSDPGMSRTRRSYPHLPLSPSVVNRAVFCIASTTSATAVMIALVLYHK